MEGSAGQGDRQRGIVHLTLRPGSGRTLAWAGWAASVRLPGRRRGRAARRRAAASVEKERPTYPGRYVGRALERLRGAGAPEAVGRRLPVDRAGWGRPRPRLLGR
ncbi:hypothetical protein GCM10010124_07130 [Pilimelia terevasa]|uniref:Uncharacterized protein n=1 Tax=Pilimelia terevasa TaxID=53372 RepID=A0A8J3FGI7_9ACTN|nr:hypothetical protein GCM10010124_07130 [Pilimelia terevasa]